MHPYCILQRDIFYLKTVQFSLVKIIYAKFWFNFVSFIFANLKPIPQLLFILYGVYHKWLFSFLPLSDLLIMWFLTLLSSYLDHGILARYPFSLISFS